MSKPYVEIVHILTDNDGAYMTLCFESPYYGPTHDPSRKYQLCEDCRKKALIGEPPSTDSLYYDDETLDKVHAALGSIGLSDHDILIAVQEMQNRGILFRERFPDTSDGALDRLRRKLSSGGTVVNVNVNSATPPIQITYDQPGTPHELTAAEIFRQTRRQIALRGQ